MSEPVKLKEAEALLVSADGWVSIAVWGAVVSIVHSKLSALWSALPALSIARTSKLWAPSASEL